MLPEICHLSLSHQDGSRVEIFQVVYNSDQSMRLVA